MNGSTCRKNCEFLLNNILNTSLSRLGILINIYEQKDRGDYIASSTNLFIALY